MADPAITLYRLQACPFCERVVNRLDELGLEYESRFVAPLHSERDVVKRLTGARTVPAIVDERTGVTMSESANIVGYLDRTYGDGLVDADDGAATDGGTADDATGTTAGEGTGTTAESETPAESEAPSEGEN